MYLPGGGLHALTVQQVPAELRHNCLSFVAQYIACGIDPTRSTIVIQSHIPQHAELNWVLNTLTSMGELSRMTQFKDKSQKHSANINAGLFTYPVLMAADILLYRLGSSSWCRSETVFGTRARPGSALQSSLLRYFCCARAIHTKVGARVMSLQDPTKKCRSQIPMKTMSLPARPRMIEKRLNEASLILALRYALTKSINRGFQILSIHSAMSGESTTLEAHFEGKLYGHLKVECAEVVVEALRPIQAQYDELMNDRGELERILANGASAAFKRHENHTKVYRKIGLVPTAR